MVQLVEEDNNTTLKQLCARLEEKTGTRVSVATLCRLLLKLELTRKSKTDPVVLADFLADIASASKSSDLEQRLGFGQNGGHKGVKTDVYICLYPLSFGLVQDANEPLKSLLKSVRLCLFC